MLFWILGAHAATVTVCSTNCDHTDFASATQAATANDVISFDEPGVYAESNTLSLANNVSVTATVPGVVVQWNASNNFLNLSGTNTLDGFTIDCGGMGQIAQVASGQTLVFEWMEVRNCGTNADGGVASLAGGTITATDSWFHGNNAQRGAVFAGNGPVTMVRNLVCGQTTSDKGGVYYTDSNGTDADFRNNIFWGNNGGNDGGVLFIDAGGSTSVVFDYNSVVSNTASGNELLKLASLNGPESYDNNFWGWNTYSSCAINQAGVADANDNHWWANEPLVTLCSDPGSGVSACDNPLLCDPGIAEPTTCDPLAMQLGNDPESAGAFNGPDATGGAWDDGDSDGRARIFDCDDTDATVSDIGTEVCDGKDNDCDGTVDDGLSCDADGDGQTTGEGDCDDNDATVYDGAPIIVGDGRDNDCSGDGEECYTDADGDGFTGSIISSSNNNCNQTGESLVDEGDCDDADPSIHPGAAEICDGIDQDCAGGPDDGLQFDDYWPDVDGDGYGDDSVGPTSACAQPTGFVLDENTDCDDSDVAVNPGETEITCNGTDDDCDPGTVDSPDGDGDGVGVCSDCNDANPDNFPGNPEVCDGADNDCNGQADNGLTFLDYYTDDDSDGYGLNGTGVSACASIPGTATDDGDCNDGDAAIHPGATELCDGLDNDCNGSNDFGGGGLEVDADTDGYLRCEGDCRDSDASVNPGAAEICDGKDNDCSSSGIPDDTEIDDDGDSYVECMNWQGAPGLDGDDCDDGEALAYPGNPEICDGIDNDCVGGVDDGLQFDLYYTDSDGDDYGDENATAQNECQQPAGTADNDLDCDDTNVSINPDASEACDSVDNNCNGQVDENTTQVDWYADGDGDGFGSGVSTGNDCAPPNVGDVANANDCDDGDAGISPAANEVCDAVDHDCDGDPENGLPQLSWYVDGDGDGYGDAGSTAVQSCAAPPGTVGDDTDCNDGDASVSPGAAEVCDLVDNDCDSQVDEGLPVQSYYADPDGDGWGSGQATQSCAPVAGLVTLSVDCDEVDPNINPGVLEICDGIDNDCSGTADDGLPQFDYWEDLDGDGFGEIGQPAGQDCEPPSGTADVSDDCDDGDPTVFPGAVEQCDGLDNNCNGAIDDNVQTTDWYDDVDGDGFGDANVVPIADCLQPPGTIDNALDCDDDPSGGEDINPDADEICDGIDNDCDGDVDDDDPSVQGVLYYPDDDMDGFGNALVPGLNACVPPSGYTNNRLDCADGNPAINPNAVEACPDGLDNDCDGLVDADDPNYTDDPVVFWFDQDGDGYGTPVQPLEACSGDTPLGYVPPTNGLDCDDSQFATNPGGTEVCDGLDNDCLNGVDDGFPTVDYYPDEDDDGFGDGADPLAACAPDLPAVQSRIPTAGDCDDSDGSVNPDALEVCDDGIDQDCDGADLVPFDQWLDTDGDGYGDPGFDPLTDCEVIPARVDNALDCDDGDAEISPDATEVCDDGVDNDCDGNADDADSSLDENLDEPTTSTWYSDAEDEDGFGDPDDSLEACAAPAGYVADNTDCDPTATSTTNDCSAGPPQKTGGCRCDAGPGVGAAGWLVFVGVLIVRRRAA